MPSLPVKFSVVSGSIPPGTKLSAVGVGSGSISGTPSAAGTFTLTIRATDQNGRTGTAPFTIRVDPPLPVQVRTGDRVARPDPLPARPMQHASCIVLNRTCVSTSERRRTRWHWTRRRPAS